MDSTSPISNHGGKPATAFSCVRCFERKVKCDRIQPCAACTRHGVECIYRVPAPPRRRKRRTQEDLLTERLRRYERVLQQQGINPSEIVPQPSPGSENSQRASQSTPGSPDVPDRKYASSQLIYDSGRSHYVENNLWNRVTEEISSPQEAFDASSSSEDDTESPQDNSVDFMLSGTPSLTAARPYHPPAEHVWHLWQIFLENVNPLSKVIHHPTLQVMIQKAMANLDKVPRGLEAMMFAIYGGAVVSLKDDQCLQYFGEKRKTLLSRYRAGTKVALARAKFMATSDFIVLQAFAIHLITTREDYDPKTLWILTGVAVRMGESMGLHRDGSSLGLPFFESEIRRRVFWQLAMLDYRSAELSGSAKFRTMFHEDFAVRIPLKVDDADLYPGMKDAPLPPTKASEMVFCSLRYEFGRFWSQKQAERASKGTQDEHLWANYQSVDAIAEKDKEIDELQRMVQTTYVRYCDPMEPLQLMTSLVASVAIASMRLVAHHPRRYSKEEDIPEKEKKLLWTTCLKLLEGDVMAYTDRNLQRFVWHTSFYFQWQAIIHVLDCLRAHPFMFEADKAWQLIEETYINRPDFLTNTKKPIHVAVGTLCLKAYRAREEAQAQNNLSIPASPPEYIIKLRQQREAAHAKQAEMVMAKLGAQQISDNNAVPPQQDPSLSRPSIQQSHNYNDRNTGSSSSTNILSFSTDINPSVQTQGMQQVGGSDMAFTATNDMSQYTTNTWVDSFGYHDPMNTEIDVDLMLSQDGNAMDMNANTVDWTQWDNLIQGFGQ